MLHYNDDVGTARRRGATSSVLCTGTSAKPAPDLGNPEWLADLEYVWRTRTAGELARLHARAALTRRAARRRERATRRALDEAADEIATRVRLMRSAKWAEQRAQALAMPRADIVAACRKRWRTIRCGCGSRELPVGCDQVQLCEWCRKRHCRRWRKRITRALGSHLRAAQGEWRAAGRLGRAPGIYLVTLTGPHSGSIAQDRERLGAAWRELTKRAQAGGWWGAYALTWEVTPGTRGDGHVHAHVAVISSWVPYERLGAAWRALVPGAVQPEIVSPSAARRRAKQRGRSYHASENAAYYLSKYVTKGVDPREFTGQKAGELLVAFRGKRRFTTSLRFWRPLRDLAACCKSCGRATQAGRAPAALVSVAPAAVLRAFAERVGWFVPRGAVQMHLQLLRK